jgi:tryptophanyl-tRNA synthetase
MRPTGRLHLGHYFGVLVNYLELQKSSDCFFMVADLHALTTGELSKIEVGKNTRELLLDWLSVGVDPDKATLFVQSAVPEHCELTVLLSMFTSVGWLERNPTYKEQKQELGEKNTGSLGFLSYPVLQTVDVCLYKATHVPVGEDQKPHLEMGRELIRRFNSTYKKDVFPEFLPLLTPTAKLPGLDGRKMSKSYGNTVELAEEPESIRKKVSRMMTDTQRPRKEDPGHPENCPVFTYHQIFTPTARVSEIEKECRAATLTCFDDKKALAEQIVAWSEPIRKRRAELEKEPAYIDEIIKKGNQKARNIASQTIKEVLDVMGFWPGSNR